jgi:hypothetical protein
MAGKSRSKTIDQHQQREIQRLKEDYESRRTADRPLTNSVATAYRKVIANCERENQQEIPSQ